MFYYQIDNFILLIMINEAYDYICIVYNTQHVATVVLLQEFYQSVYIYYGLSQRIHIRDVIIYRYIAIS